MTSHSYAYAALLDAARRSSSPYVLSLDLPSSDSLVAGIDFTPPPSQAHSPKSLGRLARPPTPGGGPLSSHPATADYFFAAHHPPAAVPQADKENFDFAAMASKPAAVDAAAAKPRDGAQSGPMPPPRTKANGESLDQRRPSAVRKLLSLRDLRASFSSSRSSLVSDRTWTSTDTHATGTAAAGDKDNNGHALKRPASPTTSFSTTDSAAVRGGQPASTLGNKRKSRGWFGKRRSGLFMMSANGYGDGGAAAAGLDAVDEDARPDTRDSKRQRQLSPAPALPEIAALGDGAVLTGGSMGWDDQLFKR